MSKDDNTEASEATQPTAELAGEHAKRGGRRTPTILLLVALVIAATVTGIVFIVRDKQKPRPTPARAHLREAMEKCKGELIMKRVPDEFGCPDSNATCCEEIRMCHCGDHYFGGDYTDTIPKPHQRRLKRRIGQMALREGGQGHIDFSKEGHDYRWVGFKRGDKAPQCSCVEEDLATFSAMDTGTIHWVGNDRPGRTPENDVYLHGGDGDSWELTMDDTCFETSYFWTNVFAGWLWNCDGGECSILHTGRATGRVAIRLSRGGCTQLPPENIVNEIHNACSRKC